MRGCSSSEAAAASATASSGVGCVTPSLHPQRRKRPVAEARAPPARTGAFRSGGAWTKHSRWTKKKPSRMSKRSGAAARGAEEAARAPSSAQLLSGPPSRCAESPLLLSSSSRSYAASNWQRIPLRLTCASCCPPGGGQVSGVPHRAQRRVARRVRPHHLRRGRVGRRARRDRPAAAWGPPRPAGQRLLRRRPPHGSGREGVRCAPTSATCWAGLVLLRRLMGSSGHAAAVVLIFSARRRG